MIEQDLAPFIANDARCFVLAQCVNNQVFYGSAPEFVGDSGVRTQPPYIVIEGPVSSDRQRFSDGSSSMSEAVMRVQVFGTDMTQVTFLLAQVDSCLSALQNVRMPHTYVQCFIRGALYVDNRRLQRGKQEKDPNSSEDPLAEGHVDFTIWSAHQVRKYP